MCELLNKYNTIMFPQFIMCVYASHKNRGENSIHGKISDSFIEYFPIENGTIGAGKALPDKILMEFIETVDYKVNESENFHGLVPENMVYYRRLGKNISLIFRTPEESRLLFFSQNNKSKIKTGKYYIPNLLWVINDNNLHIYSFKHWEGQNTELLSTPFFNTSNNTVCLGSTKVAPNGTSYSDLINGWVNGFYASEFSHPSGNEITGSYKDLYKKMKKAPCYSSLKSQKITVSEICQNM